MILNLLFLSSLVFASAPSLEGAYVHSCYVVGDDVLATTMTIKGAEWIKTHTAYEDEKCQVPYLIFETRHQALVQASQVDLTAVEVSYTSLSREVTEALNLANYCGFKNWQTKQKKIVTGILCDEFQTPKRGEKLYSIFSLQSPAESAWELSLGASSGADDGKSFATRHTGYEPTPYLKIK